MTQYFTWEATWDWSPSYWEGWFKKECYRDGGSIVWLMGPLKVYKWVHWV